MDVAVVENRVQPANNALALEASRPGRLPVKRSLSYNALMTSKRTGWGGASVPMAGGHHRGQLAGGVSLLLFVNNRNLKVVQILLRWCQQVGKCVGMVVKLVSKVFQDVSY